MVTCSNIDSVSKKMNGNSTKLVTTTTTTIEKKVLESISGSLSSSGYRLLIGSTGNISGYSSGINMDDTMSNYSRNSIYKQRIDSMFDDSKSIISHRSTRRHTASISGSINDSNRLSDRLEAICEHKPNHHSDVSPVTNDIQAQIERMFTDIAQDDFTVEVTSSFSIRCLGSLPLKEKVSSLSGLQEPLRQLYLSGAGHAHQNSGFLDICRQGLRVRLTNGRTSQITPFQNIAVWSAVKFVVSQEEGGAAFLPLITDPENIDKGALFKPLSAADRRRLSSGINSPIFAVVLKSPGAKQLQVHGYICKSHENAILIAATLYQGLMSFMNDTQNGKTRKPRTRNGINCMSITSSSIIASQALISSKTSTTSSRSNVRSPQKDGMPALPPPNRPPRRKRSVSNSLSSDSDGMQHPESLNSSSPNDIDSSTDERNKKKNSRSKKPPPLPTNPPSLARRSELFNINEQQKRLNRSTKNRNNQKSDNSKKKEPPYGKVDGSTGDILTKVAIPRSGSFLNTAGLTRYKSRATRRNETTKTGTNFTSGGGGSPLGFSELFNEFRLQENLHSLDDILNAIINFEGMSFNDLKPIYKEFLLKLAVTLTKDELYQRSKSIMRRQKKKKSKRNSLSTRSKFMIGALGLKKILLGKFHGKKSGSFNRSLSRSNKTTQRNPDTEVKVRNRKLERSRMATSESEVSVHRTDNLTNLHNRNSSSGYVSCSECSYDSDSCTCDSADRCYCSLGGDDINMKLNKAEREIRDLRGCNTDSKCYCSVGEEDADGTTTWCDTDSCDTETKCYSSERKRSDRVACNAGNRKQGLKKDNLALDYELFTVGSNTRHVKPNEALSVKKSVEMAALFADVKLSQTTDITNFKPSNSKRRSKPKHQHSSSGHHHGDDSEKVVLRNKKNFDCNDNYIIKSNSKDFLLKNDIDINNAKRLAKSEELYQAISPRPVSASLEDSLGYLP